MFLPRSAVPLMAIASSSFTDHDLDGEVLLPLSFFFFYFMAVANLLHRLSLLYYLLVILFSLARYFSLV